MTQGEGRALSSTCVCDVSSRCPQSPFILYTNYTVGVMFLVLTLTIHSVSETNSGGGQNRIFMKTNSEFEYF